MAYLRSKMSQPVQSERLRFGSTYVDGSYLYGSRGLNQKMRSLERQVNRESELPYHFHHWAFPQE